MRLTSLIIVSLTLSGPVFADWEGTIKVKMPAGQNTPTEMTGKVRTKKHMQRTDFKTPMDMSTIVDMKNKKVLNLVHAQKMAMEIDADQAGNKTPSCSTEDVDGCLKKQGFKKVGTETVNGHPSTIYENTIKENGESAKIKLWRPNDLKEVAAVKSVVTTSQGDVVVNITDIKTVSLPDSVFKVPSGYNTMDMKNMGKMFKKR